MLKKHNKNNLKNFKKTFKKPLTTAFLFAIIGNVPSEQNRKCESGGIGRRARLRGVW